jgi:DNA processing protein
VSGGAHGIDAAAHRAAIETGVTVVVAATGADVAFPSDHASLFERVAQSGAIVSELLPGTLPRKSFFPTRNRIIAALTSAVIVVRGGEKSGALITARWALRLGRPVAALSCEGPLGGAARSLQRHAQQLDSIASAEAWIGSIARSSIAKASEEIVQTTEVTS